MTIKSKLGFLEGEKFDLARAVDNHLNSKEFPLRDRTYFYMSEIGKSTTELHNKIVKKKNPKFEARVKRILENGNYVHARFQALFVEMGIHIASEIDIGDDLVHGRLDSIITDGVDNYVVEIKSCSQWTFNKLEKPTKEHELQLQLYLYYTKLYKGLLFYECKDNQNIRCFEVSLDKKRVEDELLRLKKLKEDFNMNDVTSKTSLENIQYGS